MISPPKLLARWTASLVLPVAVGPVMTRAVCIGGDLGEKQKKTGVGWKNVTNVIEYREKTKK